MIKWVRIQNFRSLLDVTVDLDPLTVLIGRSGRGKSNFVQAIRFLRDSLNDRNVNVNRLGGPHRVLHVDHQQEPLDFNLRFSIARIGESFEYRLRGNPVSAQVLEEYLKFGEKLLFHQEAGKWVHPPEVLPTPPPQGIMLGAIPGLQESTFAYVALRSGIGCYDFPGEVLTGQGNQGHPSDHGFADRGDNYLLIAERILSDLSKAHSWKRIAKSIQAVNRTASSLTLNAPQPDRLDIGYQLNGRLLTFDVRQESEGLRRFLAHMLAMYQNPSKQTLFFEHPESGLHPGALESLAHEFKACSQDGRGQVILTTHSPQLLDYFPPESLRVVDVENMATRIGPVAPEQMEALREQLLQPGELLTVDPARLAGDLAEVPE
ncbi:MAG TPA: AAA family ATPase [Gemmataceae bacterium]|nr:AAA family ATPase [Gemmataceae bacterium]